MKRITLFLLCIASITTAILSCSGSDDNATVNNTVVTLTTPVISSVTGTSAVANASISSNGGSTVTARGFCWATTPAPTTENSTTAETGNTPDLTSTIDGLTPNTTYYIRAYATNSSGTAYGPETSFTTLNTPSGLPGVTTAAISSINQNSATGGGTVIGDGGSQITQRGICWSTNQQPTTANNIATATGTTGAFTVALTGLNPSTTYYVRAFATNSNGTSYGNQLSFTTEAGPTTGPQGGNAICNNTQPTAVVTVTSATGKIWMDRNLGASRAATSSKDYQAYGCLYQWGRGNDGHASITWTMGEDDEWGNLAGQPVNGTTYTQSTTDTPPNALFIADQTSMPYDWRNPKNNNLWQGVNGINNPCPAGFRIPTKAEFEAEIAAYSITNSATAFSSIHKLPQAGRRAFDSGMVNGQGESIYYWTSTVDSFGDSYNVLIYQGSVYTNTANGRAGGYSVRCIKN